MPPRKIVPILITDASEIKKIKDKIAVPSFIKKYAKKDSKMRELTEQEVADINKVLDKQDIEREREREKKRSKKKTPSLIAKFKENAKKQDERMEHIYKKYGSPSPKKHKKSPKSPRKRQRSVSKLDDRCVARHLKGRCSGSTSKKTRCKNCASHTRDNHPVCNIHKKSKGFVPY